MSSLEAEEKYGVPKGWLGCPKIGQIVENLFLPFKTPLCGLYDNQVEAHLRFHPEDVFNSALLDGKKMGLWIDFTKTDRFYFVEEVEKHGCTYTKIRMEGHHGSPTEEQIQEFVQVVQSFVRNHPGEIVGVHCTHGFNHTGFAIASYLVAVKEMAVSDAVQTFAKLRPCGIYKQEYINDLFARYGMMEDCVEAPEQPKWKSFDDPIELHDPEFAGSGKPFIPKLMRNVIRIKNRHMQRKIREKISEIFGRTRDAVKRLKLETLHALPIYDQGFNSSDFIRVHVLILPTGVYVVDSENKVYQIVGLSFPPRESQQFMRCVLLDAVIVFDKVDNIADKHFSISCNVEDVPWLLVSDMFQYNGFNVGRLGYADRLSWANREIVQPWNLAFDQGTLLHPPMTVGIMDSYAVLENKCFGPTAEPWRFCGDRLEFPSDDGFSEQESFDVQDLLIDGLVKHVYLETDFSKKQKLRGKIREICRSRIDSFPGRDPASLRLHNLCWFAREAYLVTKGEDGMRCLLYVMDQDEVYALDRDNEVFYIEGLDFPHRKENRSVRNTLLDAEIIIDKNVVNGVELVTPRLLIYDIIQLEELFVASEHYMNRRMCIDHEIIRPRKRAQATGTLRQQPMEVRIKDFHDLNSIHSLFSSSVGDEIDHLTFVPFKRGYFSNRMLEWKTPEHETVHLLMKIESVKGRGDEEELWANLYVRRIEQPVDRMKVSEILQRFDGKIVECAYDVESSAWIFIRESPRPIECGFDEYSYVFEKIAYSAKMWRLVKYVSDSASL